MIRGGFSSVTFRSMISDLLACEHRLKLLINFSSEITKFSANHVSRFRIFKWQRNPNRAVNWCLNWVCGCWRRLIAESMSFSGYFNFKNIPFKFLHSCKTKSCVDDKRFARSNIVLRSDRLYRLSTWLW